ncbi:MAG: hypothetical protein ACI8RD_002384 [Bacillariaceae sp.]|jgi:hypothetical protein
MSTDASTASVSKSKATATTKSSDASELKIQDDEEISSQAAAAGDTPDLSGFTQPLRIESTKMTFEARLTGTSSSLQARENMLLRRKDALSSRSGSVSPLQRGNISYTFDGGSSISSLEDLGIDTDILTDKMGVLELNLKTQQEITQSLHKSLSNLPAVNERLRDESLEDCHAFTDLKREGTLSRGGSIATGGEVSSNVLEPLEEIEDEDDIVNERTSKIKITNLAEILEAPDEEEVGETNAGVALSSSN